MALCQVWAAVVPAVSSSDLSRPAPRLSPRSHKLSAYSRGAHVSWECDRIGFPYGSIRRLAAYPRTRIVRAYSPVCHRVRDRLDPGSLCFVPKLYLGNRCSIPGVHPLHACETKNNRDNSDCPWLRPRRPGGGTGAVSEDGIRRLGRCCGKNRDRKST